MTVASDLTGLFKQVYGDSIINLIPETAKLIKRIPFTDETRIGDKYNQPVQLSYPHGVTYAAPGAGAFSLRSAVAMKMQNAKVDGSQLMLRDNLDYETATKATSEGAKSFARATRLQIAAMTSSITKRVELDFLYGQTGVGVADTSVNQSTTTTLITLTTASWATGIWMGMENCPLQFWKQSDGSLVSSGTDSIFSVVSVDVRNRKITVSGSTTGISALDTALGLGDCDIYFDTARASASSWNEMVGLDKIITNTGTLFEIDASTYNLWKGNTFSVGNKALSFATIMEGVALPTARGLEGELTLYVNENTWRTLATDQASLRRYDGTYSAETAKNGTRSIRFYSANGEITIEPYNCIKEGEAYGLPLKSIKRIGSQDISFKSPGTDGNIFRELENSAGFEYRVYCDQAIFLERPATAIKFTNIVNG